jgi:hypothetical protein
MPEYRRSTDVVQGYNYKKDKQTPMGFITELKIGPTVVKADQACLGPMDGKVLQVVAVLSGAQWDTGITDGVYLAGQLSGLNRQIVATMLYNDLVNTEVVFKYTVYEFDPVAKAYFPAFVQSKDEALNGLLEKRGEDLNLSVADDPSTEVQSPENYAFMIGIKPKADKAQSLTIATSTGGKVAKSWGLKVG